MLRHYDLAKAKLLNCPSPQAPSPCDASTAPTNGCESAGACSASSNTTKYGSDGTIYCINGGTVSGTVGSCECTCKSGYTGSSCETASSPSQKAKETKEKVEKTCDAMLTGVTDAKLKKKTKLLADAAISGKKVGRCPRSCQPLIRTPRVRTTTQRRDSRAHSARASRRWHPDVGHSWRRRMMFRCFSARPRSTTQR